MSNAVSFAEYRHTKKLQEYDQSKKEGVNINFGMLDWELLYIYDAETQQRIECFPHIDFQAKWLYVILHSFLIENRTFCFPGPETLARISGLKRRTVDKYLNILYAYELIDILKYQYQGCREKNVYVVNGLDKKQIYEDVYSFKDKQPSYFKPAITRSLIDYDAISLTLENKLHDKFTFIGHKRTAPKKERNRNKKGQFSDGTELHRESKNEPDGKSCHGTTVNDATGRWQDLPCNNINSNNIDLNEIETAPLGAGSQKNYKIIDKIKIGENIYKFRDDGIIYDGKHEHIAKDWIQILPEDHPIRLRASDLYKI